MGTEGDELGLSLVASFLHGYSPPTSLIDAPSMPLWKLMQVDKFVHLSYRPGVGAVPPTDIMVAWSTARRHRIRLPEGLLLVCNSSRQAIHWLLVLVLPVET